ncbi:hypothetical protein [Lentzea sp. NBRC 102530]|uniref:hypothetical protein n=1 Tax=Lentzea sp. NBRC 102530 TaxID=3032201 RepID=UPI0025567F8F|nr:hypothetical protein [Lentzea sp. NBRC 102530]
MSSVTTAIDDSDDMKIYQFDREASMDFLFPWGWCTTTGSGKGCVAYDEVLAA